MGISETPCSRPLRRSAAVRYNRAMAKKSQQPPKTFEEAIQELEKILSEIESGGVGLEESLARYERGTFLVQHCRGVLAQAEKQIEQISKGPDGTTTTEPLEEKPE